MACRGRDAKRVIDVLSSARKGLHICRSCLSLLSRRSYASAAAAQVAVQNPEIGQTSHDDPASAVGAQSRIQITAGIVLSRPPLTTPDLHPFETAYYLYQRRLNERLVLPFTQYFYFRRGTPAFDQWRTKRNQRGGVATRDIGKYNAYDKEAWNDEVLMGNQVGDKEKVVEQLLQDEGRSEEFAGDGEEKKLAGLRRTTAADQQDDQRSLERKLSRTLYLLVKNKKPSKDALESIQWRFPAGKLEGKENLKEAAQRVLDSACGVNMNTWFVGNHPIGHQVRDYRALPASERPSELSMHIEEEKTFFMKARIMAGQADLKSNLDGLEDFKWLSRDEIETVVEPGYWAKIKNMLVDR